MNLGDLPDTSWIASAVGRAEEVQRWADQVKAFSGATAITGSIPDVTEIVGSVPSVTDMIGPVPSVTDVVGSMPSVTDMVGPILDVTEIVGSMPSVTDMVGAGPEVTELATASVPGLTGTIRGPLPGAMLPAGSIVGDFTNGVSLDAFQRSIGLASAAQRSPAYGGTFRPPTGLVDYQQVVATAGALATATPSPVVPWKGERPRLRPDRQSPIHDPLRDPFLPSRPRRREPAERRPTPAPAPEVRPEEIGPELAQAMTRRHRQEAKGLLVAVGLDLELEHLVAIEKRMLGGGRPDHLQAALSASLLLEGVANRLFPARSEPWISRFGSKHEVGPENVRNRLSAFAEPVVSQWSTIEHRLFISEFDLVGRWTREGHHVVFSPEENAEAFRAFLKILATVARAHRLS
jgi:hypothetical protein